MRRDMRSPGRPWTAVVAALAVGAGCSALAAPAVAAPVVGCGAVVEGDAVLTADLICRRSPVGLTLLDGASLDLNGFRLVGGGSGTGLLVPSDGATTIRGGVVRGWAAGVALDRTDDLGGPAGALHVEDMTFRENTTGLDIDAFAIAGPATTVTSSTFVGNRLGISALDLWGGGLQLAVSASRFTDNDGGIELDLSVATIVDSVFAFNGGAVGCHESSCRIEDSTLRDNGTAIATSWYGAASVHRSTITRNDVGLTGYWGPVENEVVDSTFSDNGTAVRLYDTRASLTGNRFVRNEVAFEGLGDSGFTATLVGNEFRRNGDGVLSVSEGSELQGNTAVNNERWGIHAPGAIDLGGNTARGNGNEPQCVGVICGRPGPVS